MNTVVNKNLKQRMFIAVGQWAALVFLLILSSNAQADVTTQLDWDSVTWPAGSTSQSYTIGTGDISITLNGSGNLPPGDHSGLANGSPFITNDLTGGAPNPAPNSLEINVDYPATSIQQIPIIIDFTHPGGVSNVSFDIYDVDLGAWVDVVEVTATTDGINYFNPTTIVSGSANSSDGINTVTGTSGSSSSSAGTASFTFANSGITQIRIIYANQNTEFQWIALHDINFTYPQDGPDLSISKTHSGLFRVGDIGSYTLSVSNNIGGLTEPGTITVTDTLPTGLTFSSASGTGWSCGAIGQNVTCTQPGPLTAGSALPDITLDVLIGASVASTVTNTATVAGSIPDKDNSNNSSTDVATVIGTPSIVPGNKPLYFYNDPGFNLSRTPPAVGQPSVLIQNNGASRSWVITPSTQAPLIIDGSVSNIPVDVILSRCTSACNTFTRNVQVTLSTSQGVIGSATRSLGLNGNRTAYTFQIPISSDIALPASSTITATVTNLTNNFFARNIYVYPEDSGNYSQVHLTSEVVISVDNFALYDAPYPNGSVITTPASGSTVYARAEISDPFGNYDISNAAIYITDPNGTVVVSNAAMSIQASGSSGAVNTYEYSFVVPTGPLGAWDVLVVANEGSEGIVSDNDTTSFSLNGSPDVLFLKSSQVIDDPTGAVAPIAKAIPQATVQYRLAVSNHGDGATESNLTIVDPVPAQTSLCVADPCAQGNDPIRFIDAPAGSVTSGISYNYASHVEYSKDTGPTFTYGASLTPDSDGYDSGVTRVRIIPNGTLNAASGSTPAGFEILFKVQVQ